MYDEFGNWVSSASGMALGGYGGGASNIGSTALNSFNLSSPAFNSFPGTMGQTPLTANQLAPMQSFSSPEALGFTSGVGVAAPKTGIFDNFLGSPGQQGWGSLALGAAQGLMGGYLGMQQLDLGKKTLKQNQRQFDLNFGAQQKMTNSRLADRQANRVASNPYAGHASTEEYMKKYGI